MSTPRKPVPGTCKKCGVDGQLSSYGSCLKCHACGRSTRKVHTPGKIIRIIPAGTCPKCGESDCMTTNGSKGGVPYAACIKCGKMVRLATIAQNTAQLVPSKVYLITSAVNDTKVSGRAWATLMGMAKHKSAQICVIPLRYKNPTSQREAAKADGYTWDKRVLPYLVDGRAKLAPELQLLADIKTQPTAQDPLAHLDTITGTDWGIVGHTKVALRSIATRGHERAKVMMTTGAITVPVYSDTTAGIKGAFHHSMGCIVVEVTAAGFHCRHIGFAKDGSAIDLDTLYSGDTVKPAPRPASLTLGDTHAEIMDPVCADVTDRIIDRLRPKAVVHHDVLNFGSQSHHNDYFERFRRRIAGKDDVLEELRVTCAVIDRFGRHDSQTVIVSSNHNDHFRKWLESHYNALDVGNAIIYHKAKLGMLEAIKDTGQEVGPFEFVARDMLKRPALFLRPGDSHMAGGVEHAYHGDRGSGGSKGSAKALSRISAKTNIGHGHGANIVDGCYQAGTMSKLHGGYQDGAPSGWSHSHILTYANGKRAILFIHNGAWCDDGQTGNPKQRQKPAKSARSRRR